MVQNKLDILSKAGLNKDDFSKADTKHIEVINISNVVEKT